MTITFTTQVLQGQLNQMAANVTRRLRATREVVHKAMAEQFLQCTRDNFGAAGAFRLHAWKRLSPRYAKKVGRDYATLEVTGALKNAIHATANANKGSVSVSTAEVEYALAHQFGNPANNLPDRPYFPVHEDGSVHGGVRTFVVEAARLAMRNALS